MTNQPSNNDENKLPLKLIGQIVLVVIAITLIFVFGWRVKSLSILGIEIEPPLTATIKPNEVITASATSAKVVQRSEIIMPDAPLYDDFGSTNMDSNKWGQPLWENPQQYMPIQSQGALHFEISTEWFDWAVKRTQSIEEMHALVTLDSANDGAFGISLRTVETGFSYNLMLKKNHVSIWNDPKELGDFPVSGTCCAYTHLLGAVVDGSQIHFYVDNKLIGSYPFNGYPNYGTLQIAGATRTVASVSDVWIKFRP